MIQSHLFSWSWQDLCAYSSKLGNAGNELCVNDGVSLTEVAAGCVHVGKANTD